MPTRKPESNYRRRVLAVGGLAAFALYVVGAPIYNNRIEGDLERRVPVELRAAGFGGDGADPGFTANFITAKFSGQDGTLFCQGPLADPEGAIDAAHDIRGVHLIVLDRSCRVLTVADNESSEAATATENSTDAAEGAAATDNAGDTADSTASTAVETVSVGAALAADPQFSSFALLVSESEISAELDAVSAVPVTVFAPTNEAFEDVAADLLATLRADPAIRDRMLRSHMVTGSLTIDDMTTGSLTALDGTTLDVVEDNRVVTVSGATVTGGPFAATNGSVYSIDQVLVPEGVEAPVPPSTPAVTDSTDVTFNDGVITLAGVVASDTEHQLLVNTSGFGVGAENVVDLLTVNSATGISPELAASVNELIVAMRVNLVSGTVGFNGTDFYASGDYATDANRDAMIAASQELGIEADLQQRPDATDELASNLEADLNAYVAANPILFEPSSAVLMASAEPILARVAATMLELGAVGLVVEGHTDSDGSQSTNLALSQNRAAVVRDALMARGVPEGTVTSQGFGSEQPVLVDGVEDKAASRRVQFRVSVLA
ncbi:MAG TPA: fasciclin domain-containing protein [Ilumatobacter sp.]|nr:fasciclin domain-containing protein [Ilumatobacter sp.]